MGISDIKGLDVKKGLALVANNKMIYTRLLNSYIKNALCDQLIEAINNGDTADISQKAHSLKGVAGNMHMGELYELSQKIEGDAKDGAAISASDEIVARLIEANKQVLESINMMIENPAILDTV